MDTTLNITDSVNAEALLNQYLDYVFDNPTPIVYFIRCNGFVKIGQSTGSFVDSRFGELQVGNPHKLVFESYILGGHELEKRFHEELKAFRVRGEWFKMTKRQVKDFISDYYKKFQQTGTKQEHES